MNSKWLFDLIKTAVSVRPLAVGSTWWMWDGHDHDIPVIVRSEPDLESNVEVECDGTVLKVPVSELKQKQETKFEKWRE